MSVASPNTAPRTGQYAPAEQKAVLGNVALGELLVPSDLTAFAQDVLPPQESAFPAVASGNEHDAAFQSFL